MENYLLDRKQYVHINGTDLDVLVTGNKSCNQGSAMAGIIYAIYTLDIPSIFHNIVHNSISDRNCLRTSIKTFVDDIFPIVIANNNEDIKSKAQDTIEEVSTYMKSNKLAVNVPKTQIMLFTKNKTTKSRL